METLTEQIQPGAQMPFARLVVYPENPGAILPAAGDYGKISRPPAVPLTKTEFHLEAPFAKSVKLAANFTGWEKYSLDMIKSEDGTWFTLVPLPPGTYSYRFIVDGEWCDDLHAALRAHDNSFGHADEMVKTT